MKKQIEPHQELNQAIARDDLDSVETLVHAHPELINRTTTLGSCLHLAAKQGKLRIVQRLWELGADVDVAGKVGGTPVKLAIAKGHLDVAKYLIEKNARLDFDSPDANPLFSAVYRGRLDGARLLLESGINLHVVYRGISGQLKNALSYAQERGQKEIAELLTSAGCRLPVKGIDVAVNELAKTEATADSAHDQIVAHMARRFGSVEKLALHEIVPVEDPVRVAINLIPPTSRFPIFTLFTTGMSDRPMNVPKGQEAFQYAELALHLRMDWSIPTDLASADEAEFWPFQWLRRIAYYPHQNNTWLGGSRTIISTADPPVPLGPNTEMTCLLLLADVGDWSPLVLDDGRSIKFYTIAPIYTEERDFEVKHGMRALLERFEEARFTTVVDNERQNFCP